MISILMPMRLRFKVRPSIESWTVTQTKGLASLATNLTSHF